MLSFRGIERCAFGGKSCLSLILSRACEDLQGECQFRRKLLPRTGDWMLNPRQVGQRG
jgi:hypothetical protein